MKANSRGFGSGVNGAAALAFALANDDSMSVTSKLKTSTFSGLQLDTKYESMGRESHMDDTRAELN